MVGNLSHPRTHFFFGTFLSLSASMACFYIGTSSAELWMEYQGVLVMGAIGFVLAEIASNLSADYYLYRHTRTNLVPHGTLAGQMEPPQLILKVSWAMFLLAFLFVLFLFLRLEARGWGVLLLAFLGFGLAYLPESSQSQKEKWSRLAEGFKASFSTWIPFCTACYLVAAWPNWWRTGLVLLLCIALFFYRQKKTNEHRVVNCSQVKRYSSIPFPTYRHRAGRTPHPNKDPKGHSYGKIEVDSGKTTPEEWRETKPYLYGMDLFNHEFYWEAHEAWEFLWKPLDPDSAHALFLQGLIQAAAASLKYIENNRKGLTKLSSGCVEKLQAVRDVEGETYMGVHLDELLGNLKASLVDPMNRSPESDLPAFHPPEIHLI